MRKWIYLLLIAALITPLSLRPQILVAQDQGTVVADGLNGPMGVLMDESGTLWVIEAGTGGDADLPFTDPQSGQPITAKYGESAQVLTIAPDGTKKVVTALPSVATSTDIFGGARLAILNGKVYATVGQWLGESEAESGLPNMAVVAEINEGSATAVASTWDFERTQNPDGLVTDSHPFGISGSPTQGVLWIADAGGCDVAVICCQVDDKAFLVKPHEQFLQMPFFDPFINEKMQRRSFFRAMYEIVNSIPNDP